jgi:CPA2 family monovalent cation:H+ antiporter-2
VIVVERRPAVLEQAHPERAQVLVVATPDPFQARAIVKLARRHNPGLETVVRTHSDVERAWFERDGVGRAIVGEHELARTMARYALESCGLPPAAAEAAVEEEAPGGLRLDTRGVHSP